MVNQTHYLHLSGIGWLFRMDVRPSQGLPEPVERLRYQSGYTHMASGIGFAFHEDWNGLIIHIRVTAGVMSTWFDNSENWWCFSFLGRLGSLGSILLGVPCFLVLRGP